MNSLVKNLKNLQRALGIVWRSSPRWTLVSLGLLAVQGVLPLAGLYLLKLLIDSLTIGLQLKTAVAFQPVFVWIGLAGLVGILNDGCSSLSNLVQAAQAEAVADWVHGLLHAKSVEVDLAFYENVDSYNTLHRAQTEATYRPRMILKGLLQIGQSGVGLLGIILLLIALHWAIPLLLLLAILPAAWVRLIASGKGYWRARRWTDFERQAYYLHTLLTQGTHAKEVRLLDLGHLFSQRFQGLRQRIRGEKLQLAAAHARVDLVTQISATVAVLLACLFLAQQTWQGVLSLGGFMMYYQAFGRGQTLLKDLLSNTISLYENSLFLRDFYQFLDLPAGVDEPRHPTLVPQPWQQGICFDHVCFDYPHSQRSVLKDISFTLAPGEKIALVGENGAGKTTLIKLLCRLYDPTAGQIKVDGVDLRQLKTVDWRHQISVLFQDYIRYQLTAAENIGLGNSRLSLEHPDIARAAALAGADGVIQALPAGYATQLGNEFAEGEELSMGQWQKIALARSFVRDVPLLILDEPSSALDADAEAELLTKFWQLTEGKTAILISHRLSSIKLADRILVLAQGQLAEMGTHAELMALQGIYARLFTLQAEPYQS